MLKFVLTLALLVTISSPRISHEQSRKERAEIHIKERSATADSVKVWIFLKDKGDGLVGLSKKAPVSERAAARRTLRGTVTENDFYDREVNPHYVGQIRPLVLRVVHQSRWLNAVSAYVRPANLEALADLRFVREIREVAVYHRPVEPTLKGQSFEKPSINTQLDYGESFDQLDQINVITLHERGYTGDGVLILLLDTGFNLEHPVFAHLDIVGTHDFINGDDNVVDPGVDVVQQSHGTSTLSTIGGYAPGNLIGAAFDASYLLGKTEIASQEIQQEEDNWVAAIEWGETLGADVVSSSVGYTDWYTYEDMDGNTAVTTIAADLAAAHGLIVVNSVGNAGRSSVKPTLIAPSDGDSVIAAGAVSPNGVITDFSANGPTADGRIKPDVCAQGTFVRVALYDGGYSFSSGTSFSCPLVAGVVALLLQVHPDWSYGRVYQALTSTASRAGHPDTVYGYGIVDAAAAVDVDSLAPSGELVAYPNPFKEFINFYLNVKSSGEVSVQIFTAAAERVVELRRTLDDGRPFRIRWNGMNEKGEEVAAGVYIAYVRGPGIEGTKKIVKL